ncbi:MAG: chemotaxis protein CheW [Acidobacteria bacterium]|nr:chemotaxis protein CheW [Acidobacteriota bacterium]MBV9477862.1 chemotaxis protein CheW [Acidobacteriota bacterium]
MVDLVKIRKKKAEGRRQKAEEETANAPASAEAPASAVATPSEVVIPEPPAPAVAGDASPAAASKLEQFKRDAGKRRETEAARAEDVSSATAALLELLTFVIAREQYAVDIERIVEIVTPRPVTRIPNADPSIVGILSLRGTIVTLVDVRRKLRHPAAGEATPDTRIVVADFGSEMVGFVVDRVLRVVKAAASEVEPHPVVHATELDSSIRGVFRAGGALTILLDLDKLLDSRALAASTA